MDEARCGDSLGLRIETGDFNPSALRAGCSQALRSLGGQARVWHPEGGQARGELVEVGNACNRAQTQAVEARMPLGRRHEEGAWKSRGVQLVERALRVLRICERAGLHVERRRRG